MKTILTVSDYYLPGYKGGGPIRTIANMTEWLGDEFAFYILTRDRDLGDAEPYPGIRRGEWRQVGRARVRYLAPYELSPLNWQKLLRGMNYDLLYLNSFFSNLSVYTLLARRMGRLPEKPLLIGPRGEFHPGALGIKPLKKRLYLGMSRLLNLTGGVHWQASTSDELADICRIFPAANSRVHTALDLGPRSLPSVDPGAQDKRDATRIIFLSRISRKKGLDVALKILSGVRGKVEFDIYGPAEDEAYWAECQQLIAALPENVRATYKGAIHPDEIITTFSKYHAFLFPTRGENFGHVIWEALYAGCLPIISDRTPWNDLDERGVGWVRSLEHYQGFIDAIQELIAMDETAFQQRARAANVYARNHAKDEGAVQSNREIFNAILRQPI